MSTFLRWRSTELQNAQLHIISTDLLHGPVAANIWHCPIGSLQVSTLPQMHTVQHMHCNQGAAHFACFCVKAWFPQMLFLWPCWQNVNMQDTNSTLSEAPRRLGYYGNSCGNHSRRKKLHELKKEEDNNNRLSLEKKKSTTEWGINKYIKIHQTNAVNAVK